MAGLTMIVVLAASACRGGGGDSADARVNGDGGNGDGPPPGTNSIYQIQMGAVAVGTTVTVRGVVVTGIDRYGGRVGGFYVEEKQAGAFSGVYVFGAATTTVDTLSLGDVVDIEGAIVDEFALATDTSGRTITELSAPMGGTITVTKTGTDAVPAAEVVDPVAMAADDAEAEKWEGVLVVMNNVAITSGPSGVSMTDPTLVEMEVTGPFRVGSSLTALDAAAIMRDDCYTSITGIGDYFFNYKVLPRTGTDLVVAGSPAGCMYEDSVAECMDGTDDDHDGFMDCADFSCQVADPADCQVDATISEIQMGTVPVGTLVNITGAVVTGRATNNKTIWIEDVAGGQYSGIAVFNNAGLDPTLVPGDIVSVTGNVDEFMGAGDTASITEITTPTVTRTGTGGVIAPAVVMAGTLVDPGTAEPYEGVLVQVPLVAVVAIPTIMPQTFGEWVVNTAAMPVRVDDAMYTPYSGAADPLMGPAVGTCYASITGPFHYSFNAYKIEPRTAADLVGGGVGCP